MPRPAAPMRPPEMIPGPDIRRTVKRQRAGEDRAYMRRVIHELEQTYSRSGFLNTVDEIRLAEYRRKYESHR